MEFASPLDAIKHGINIIYQERQLVPYLTVMENVYMENIPARHGVVDYKNANERTQNLIDMFVPVSYTHLDVYKRQPGDSLDGN